MMADTPPSRSTKSLTAALSRFAEHQEIAKNCAAFLDASPEPFHATHEAAKRLEAAGFIYLDERESWTGKLKPGGKYYYTRNRSCIVAFVLGGKFEAGNGIKIIGAHQDSPNLRLKPRTKLSGSGCLQLDVECYGGGLWHTWFDRDLSLSGRVFVKSGERVIQRLVRIDRPVLRVPNLCIHLQTPDERAAFKINKEDHLQPILAMEAQKILESSVQKDEGEDEEGDEKKDESQDKKDAEQGEEHEEAWANCQEPMLMGLLAEALQVNASDILDFELSMYDTQKASISGAGNEFLCSARLDDLAGCFVATQALIDYASDQTSIEDDVDVSLIALFDHEEVGSDSTVGAGSPIMGEAVRRITTATAGGSFSDDLTNAATRRSFVLSVDMAHAVHPNYQAKHQKSHGPKMNKGIVIKSNQNQRYASNGVTSFIVRELARRHGMPPPQEFVVRNDCPCGSTIGPIISANTGIRCVDLGMPQLSMHSIREMMGVADLTNCLKLFSAFYKDFNTVDSMLDG
mmetsp:Transcript_123246/g.200512  ORF Transcript_123246/g.200512 Transcript_123246/m.200512 type:complete len:515 (+) Transcript_123246:2-1546(+)